MAAQIMLFPWQTHSISILTEGSVDVIGSIHLGQRSRLPTISVQEVSRNFSNIYGIQIFKSFLQIFITYVFVS